MTIRSTINAVVRFLKTAISLLIGVAVLVLVFAWLSGMFGEKIQPGETTAVERHVLSEQEAAHTDEVHEVVKQYVAESVGTLRAASRTEIAARIMAPIHEIRVKAGDVVEAGQVVVVLDQRDVQSRLSQLKAALESAQASLTQAENDFQRDSELFAENVIAQQQFEQSRTLVDVTRANVKRAQEAIAEAQVNLSYTAIRAHQAGKIVDRLAEPGDIAQPGVPLLSLYDPASLRLEVPVTENLALKMKVGDALTVKIDALDQEVKATVDEIVPQAEAASRSFLVKVALPRTEEFFEGMFGRLLIPAGSRRHLCLNTEAIQTIGQLQFVNVVSADGRTAQRRFITTGRIGMPGRIEVLSGVKAGEQVLVASPRQNEPGEG